jgi:RNA polymerase sigma factor (sigma-70 family)
MRVAGRTSEADGRVAGLLALHGAALRRVARRWSLCEEDAEDALQRALEIYVRRLDSVARATEAAWLKVVIRNEALAIRRTRGESVAREDVDLDARNAADVRALDDRLAARERTARSAEALRELKHDEALALLLKAEGHSYREIAASQGWSYTKVNRAVTEGRARFMKSFRAIEEGEACDRLAPVLAALAAGSATSAQLREARPHLRHCAACRAALRALHAPLRRRVAALLPLGPVVTPVEWAHRHLSEAPSVSAPPDPAAHDPTAALHPLHVPNVEDAARVERLPRPRTLVHDLLHRIGGSDLATSVQAVAGLGGGRSAAVAALLGVCLSGLGAGTYCAATALLPDPPVVTTQPKAKATSAAATHRPRARQQTASAPAAKPRMTLVATPVPTATRTPRPPSPPRHRSRTSSSSSPSSSASRQEFGFESATGSSGTSTPTARTASTGGSHSSGGRSSAAGEFLP